MLRPKSVATASKTSVAPAEFHDELYNIKEHRSSSGSEKNEAPSPLDFDAFIPWVCKQWCGSAIILVTPMSQEQLNIKPGQVKHAKSKTKSMDAVSDCVSIFDDFPCPMTEGAIVPLTTYYDSKHQLVEIAIVNSHSPTPRKLIQAISLSIPYHTKLTRFTFRRSPLTAELVYEINKLLVVSNICEIILDDTYVPEGNYYILLEQFSQLKYLSLNRCHINDETCMKIFANINSESSAANTLRILELGSNNIADVGAKFIGSVLRTNRCLLHLNLSDNNITDTGFTQILDSLKEFPLESKEKISMRRRKFRYIQSKMAVYLRCLNDLKCGYNLDSFGGSPYYAKGLLVKRSRNAKKKEETEPIAIEDEAEYMTKEIVGEFNDPFSPNDVVIKNGSINSKGNFVLCSLNVAYNDLNYPSLRKLNEVLEYQHQTFKGIIHTGLIRVTLEGNNLPKTCPELDNISFYFRNIINMKSIIKVKQKPLGSKSKRAFNVPIA